MLKTKLLILVSFLTSLTATAQKRQSVLWEVSGHGLAHSSYLFGTIHTVSPTLLDKFPVKQYLSQTQFGVFEIQGNPIAPAPPPPNRAPERPQPPLDSLFSKRDYAVVDSFFSASPLGGIKAHNTDADLGAMLYAVKMLKTNPATDSIGLDDGIAREMQRTQKPIFRLDTDDDPDRRNFETRYAELASLIVALIQEKNSEVSAVLTGDLEAAYVAELMADLKLNQEATGGLRELTVRRNLLWMPQLTQKMQEGACFVAVGVGHLQYKNGLIALLRQQGYKVKPVKLPRSS